VSEPGLHICRCDGSEGTTQGFQQLVKGARFQFTQDGFHLRPTFFNWIQVGRIGRQEFQACPTCRNQALCDLALVNIQIINEHHVALAKRWSEHLLDIRIKGVTRHPTFQNPRGAHFCQTQGRDQGVMFPGIAGRRFRDSCARGGASKQPRQTQMRPAFIDEFQAFGEGAQPFDEVVLKVLAERLHARRVALTVVQ